MAGRFRGPLIVTSLVLAGGVLIGALCAGLIARKPVLPAAASGCCSSTASAASSCCFSASVKADGQTLIEKKRQQGSTHHFLKKPFLFI